MTKAIFSYLQPSMEARACAAATPHTRQLPSHHLANERSPTSQSSPTPSTEVLRCSPHLPLHIAVVTTINSADAGLEGRGDQPMHPFVWVIDSVGCIPCTGIESSIECYWHMITLEGGEVFSGVCLLFTIHVEDIFFTDRWMK